MATTEIIDIVDANNNIIGSTNVKNAHEQKLMHRIIGIFVFDENGQLYVQKENKYKKIDLSVGGHVKKGESCESAAQREMMEEIRLNVPINYISTFLPKDARLNHYWSIYTAIAPPEWKFKKTREVKSLEKISIKDLTVMMKNNPNLFTHGFINAMKEFINIKKV